MEAMQCLFEIMEQLRDPDKGCPWDLRQSYSTIVTMLFYTFIYYQAGIEISEPQERYSNGHRRLSAIYWH
jgi:uncharacterized protein YabN with tetrapyrrole methylase and pyrophosphatase domain